MSTNPFQRHYDEGFSDGMCAMANAVESLLDGKNLGEVWTKFQEGLAGFQPNYDLEGFLRRVSEVLSRSKAAIG